MRLGSVVALLAVFFAVAPSRFGAAFPLPQTWAISSTQPLFIRLRYATFDPIQGEPTMARHSEMAPNLRSAASSADPSIYLLQFAGPVRAEWKAAVQKAGVRLYGYIPDYAFIARMDSATANSVQAFPYVRWVGPYHPIYRLSPEFRNQVFVAPGEAESPSPVSDQWSVVSDQLITVTVQTLPGFNLGEVARQVEALSGVVQDQTANSFAGYLRVSLPTDQLDDLAALDGVLWVEPYFRPELTNDVGGGVIMQADSIRSSLGLYGSGQIVGVSDSGLDVGVIGPAMSDDFEERILEGQAVCDNFGMRSTWNDLNAHGTHIAGSVLGSGRLSGSDPIAHNYAGSFAGVAPEAQLVFQALDDDGDNGLECIPLDLDTYLFSPAYTLGARIHTNSWGGPTGGTSQNPEYGSYTNQAQIVDQSAWAHPELLILYSAGNHSTDANADGLVDLDSVGSPGTAKNVLTVGASENLRADFPAQWGSAWPDNFPAAPISCDAISDNANGMAAFSSRGPTDDGRVKPDVVAPGTAIISSRSHDPNALTGWGEYNEHYLYMGGTSTATPLVAGSAALAREWYNNQGVTKLSAALIKATLINGAADMSPGQYGEGNTQEIPASRPNYVSGWGRVDLVGSLAPPAPRKVWFTDNITGLNTGDTAVYTLTANLPQSGEPGSLFRVTLAWTDYPGQPGAARALVNDLDLEVIAPDSTHHYGNQGLYASGQCLREARWDACNNVEGVIISETVYGAHTVIVHGANVPYGPQPFALVASGDNLNEGASTLPNRAPYEPTDPRPANEAIGVPLTQTLAWRGGDPDDQGELEARVTYTVAFGTRTPPPVVTSSLTITSYDPHTLTASTTYYWLITATDGISVTGGEVWRFTTLNHAPDMPAVPAPLDGATGVPLTQTLRWQSDDPDGHALTYTLAFGTSPPPPVATSSLTITSYDPHTLTAGTTYYWLITATDGISVTEGEVWRFTTLNHAPDIPAVLAPFNGATGVPLTQTLHWQSSDPDGHALTYTLAFGRHNPPPVVTLNLSVTSYDPGLLSLVTTYYWAVTATDNISASAGPVWRFITRHPVYLPIVLRGDRVHGAR